MTGGERALHLAEAFAWPDPIMRLAIAALVGRTHRRLDRMPRETERIFAEEMAKYPIAVNVQDANAQHYEVPAAFFALILGPRRKYSSGLYDGPATTLGQAEERALAETADHAGLADGQKILELGCGWGSLSLWMAQNYSGAHVTAVSNSHSQRDDIHRQSAASGLANLDVVTADMNTFEPAERYDRIVSVEMFEHMANWRTLLARMRSWLKPDGRVFLHVFSHQHTPYRFDTGDKTDWIAQHFFTGGLMPSHGLIRRFDDIFSVESEWRWSGTHYQRTADDWLRNFDRNRETIDDILRQVYGDDAALWGRRWRLFFLATSGLFGYRAGREWGVSHYRLRPVF